MRKWSDGPEASNTTLDEGLFGTCDERVLYITTHRLKLQCRGGAAKLGFISITYHKYILGVYKYILRLEISIFDRKNR